MLVNGYPTQPLSGVITAMVTPLDRDCGVDYRGLERLVEHLIGGGVHGLFILGTTGEAPNLAYDVRYDLIEQTCKLVRSRVPVIVGITDTCHQGAIRVAIKAQQCGAYAVVAAPPYYFHVPPADLRHYFQVLASQLPLPLFLYNAPLNTPLWIDVDTAVQLAAEPNIIGLKDSGLNMGYLHAVREAVKGRPEFSFLVGPDELLAEAVLLGAHGGMAGGSNVWPHLFVALYQAARAGDLPRVGELHRQVMQFDQALYRSAAFSANPLRGLKCALACLGMMREHMTLPLRPYSTEERTKVEKFLKTVDPFAPPAGS
jgi:4-hydroxy-tetrahydrodipicolinate synthase